MTDRSPEPTAGDDSGPAGDEPTRHDAVQQASADVAPELFE